MREDKHRDVSKQGWERSPQEFHIHQGHNCKRLLGRNKPWEGAHSSPRPSSLPPLRSAVAAAVDAAVDSCNVIRDFVDFAFCASRLRPVPWGASADRRGHLLIEADLVAASGASSRYTVTAMVRDERDALEACGNLYGSASVPALRLMRWYAVEQSWGAARSLLPLTGQAGIRCEVALRGAARRMARANREFDQLITMVTVLLMNNANVWVLYIVQIYGIILINVL
ncbi:uncharacterized protein LOC133906812 [Phragmites australis]|uniref:uncharacterized protein LOC133906812 n=1 Tax=Phragmites australis TaxID=29695 RepID=UPI002D77DE59|nr:uncharacterized protein LOC133906812 [Phragmites australis]